VTLTFANNLPNSIPNFGGIIPANWNRIRLKHLTKEALAYGANEAALEDNPSYPRFIRITDIKEDGSLRPETFKSLPPEVAQPYLLDDGDVLLARSGATVGKAFIYRKEWGTACFAGYLIRCRCNQKILIPDFFFYYTQSIDYWSQIYAGSIQATIQNFSGEKYGEIFIYIPPKSQQFYIVNYLDRETTQIDNLIAAKEQMLTLLEEKRAALINHIFTRGLNPNTDLKPSGIAWLGEIPKSWEVRRGKYLFSQSSLPVRETDEIVTCFRDGQVTLRKNRREDGFTNAVLELGYQGIRKGQLILHSMDAFAGSIGISDSDGKCSPEYIICDPLFDGIDSQYYALLLRVMALRGFIQAACTAVRERAPRIRFSHLANMFLPLPPISEQQAIVQTIEQEKDSTKDLVIALTNSIALLKERRSALITAAVTGQISIQEKSKHSQNEVSQ
jgi:type I restriction enzyme S subunit